MQVCEVAFIVSKKNIATNYARVLELNVSSVCDVRTAGE